MHCSMWFLYGEPLTVVTVHFSGVHTYTSILVNVMLSIRFGFLSPHELRFMSGYCN